tara:strand:- start:1441 stop:2991 length:1551 start_codon:yes stop_codon:yes gene_type:complete
MAGKVRYLLNRDGRYFARLVIPKELRSLLDGKSELRTPLGPDFRVAMRMLPGAVADLQHKIAGAERKVMPKSSGDMVARYPMRATEIAAANYRAQLAFDDELRRTDPRYASFGYVDEDQVQALRDGMAGKLTDAELARLVGHRIERYRALGNHEAKTGTPEWRNLAMTLCFSEYEALARTAERDEGDYSGKPATPYLDIPEEAAPAPVPLRQLFKDYIASRKLVGAGREAETRWAPVIEDLIKHVGHSDALRITKADLRTWRDKRMTTHAPKTVSTVYLASIRTIFNWAVQNDRLPTNEVANVRQTVPKKIRNREKGYTTPEATAIIKAAVGHVPAHDSREAPKTTAAKRWVPLLCAYSGARVVEITQLRREDFRLEGDALIMRITPEAGTVKTGEYRDVPIHRQLVGLGFDAFLDGQSGPIFYNATKGRDPLKAARAMSGKISGWLNDANLTPEGVAPNHGWRHRFKTVGRELGISDRVLDALNGHASTTSGDSYGDVTLKTKIDAINKIPEYPL